MNNYLYISGKQQLAYAFIICIEELKEYSAWDNENDGSSNSVIGHDEKVLGFSILGGLGHSLAVFQTRLQ